MLLNLTRHTLLWAALSACAASAQAQEAHQWTRVERLGAKFVADGRGPGLSLAVSRNGAIVFARSWGRANIEPGEAVAQETLFRIASVTKTFIGALFLRLERAGKLSLDDPASRWLPEFPRAAEFTVRMLLNHTSGLGEYTDQPLGVLVRDGEREYKSDELVAYMAAIVPLFVHEPGAAWAYSNTGYVLLGVIAERAGASQLPTLIEQHLTTPAGLRETAWDENPDTTPRRAVGYGFRKNGWVRAPAVSASYVGVSGAIRATASDLCRGYDALFGGALLTPEEVRTMTTPATLADGSSIVTRRGVGYGLGVRTGMADGGRVFWHSGSTACRDAV